MVKLCGSHRCHCPRASRELPCARGDRGMGRQRPFTKLRMGTRKEQSAAVVPASRAGPVPHAGASVAGGGAALPVSRHRQTKAPPARQWAMGFPPAKLTPPNWLY